MGGIVYGKNRMGILSGMRAKDKDQTETGHGAEAFSVVLSQMQTGEID